ncbi:SHOCT domain-containing protein [Hymenobacter sp. BT175]|uniref:SHOCT domain-containing protein n=1 Tax=Hymenobacter translucens TaxID=2886507 RepID=UPI001D0E98B0|nr:SHOCT domain-containing protein [Hymenobacter translucens]MCC2547723.1 SHOCT domain-containing protein [Hymenobacter translucens]
MESKSWDFGTAQAKVKIEDGQLTWSLFGNGGSSYPLRSVNGIQYETAGMFSVMGHMVILASGGDNRKVQVPKSEKSAKIIQEINEYIRAYQQKGQAPAASQGVSVADELTKLAQLKTQGVLTEEEFQEQKRRLLAS